MEVGEDGRLEPEVQAQKMSFIHQCKRKMDASVVRVPVLVRRSGVDLSARSQTYTCVVFHLTRPTFCVYDYNLANVCLHPITERHLPLCVTVLLCAQML